MMFYVAYIQREGKNYLAEFPDAPGCQTFAASEEGLWIAAHEALEGWLEAHLASARGQVPPRLQDRSRAPRGRTIWRIPVNPRLASAIQLRWARADAGLTQAQLAGRANVSQQQIAKLEDPSQNATLETLSLVGAALGVVVSVLFETPAKPLPRTRRLAH
jgi:predicted RNase H-like HicB family nuclease/DNA-binding XRE family transcriptional regulator